VPETHRAPLATFAVIRDLGPAWDRTRSMREQPEWESHAEFMDALADEGFIVVGGPLGDEARVLHIVLAADEQEVERRFAQDPWGEDMLRMASIEPWTIVLGSLVSG
jgi:uncharacterized protein YciI